MQLTLHKSKVNSKSSICITGSKSETNRLLVLQALYPELHIENISNSDDSKAMQMALASNSELIDVHHAGTTMRFLNAYFASIENAQVTLTGSSRMKERPIKVLVDALIDLGAEISYLENEGCPPIHIKGQQLTKQNVSLNANVSSQYSSALLLIAPKLKNGLELNLVGEITSVPYIEMTLSLLNQIGVKTRFEGQKITVYPKPELSESKVVTVESDWSSASYYYSCVALSSIGTEIELSAYKKDSLQGDSILAEIYKDFGVQTSYIENTIILTKKESHTSQKILCDLNTSPDIAQTIVVTCLALGIACELSGLHTLKIKETDRLVALKTEIEKLGGIVAITNHSLQLSASKTLNTSVKIATYNDHRMAMAFAPLALIIPVIIDDANVVSKSYPSFWNDLKTIGFKITE